MQYLFVFSESGELRISQGDELTEDVLTSMFDGECRVFRRLRDGAFEELDADKFNPASAAAGWSVVEEE